jgi:hypothetical protein
MLPACRPASAAMAVMLAPLPPEETYRIPTRCRI